MRMLNKGLSVVYDIIEYHKSQHCNNEKDDNVMCTSAWFEVCDGLF